MSSKQYHKEIDGLRAVSVLVIIFYHLKFSLFIGGFVGVDVFFVISGYLITQIITANLEDGQFSFSDFYIRRGTRILPALVVTVLLVLAIAAYLQQPVALVHTAKESISALLSLSNVFFWYDASYWAPSSEGYALLHTWSLGVEEQFYLIYPLLLFVSHRVAGMKGVITTLVLLVVLGTIANQVGLGFDRSAAFYFTPMRFYEFAVGGLGAMFAARFSWLRKSGFLSGLITIAGLIFILYSAVRFNPVQYQLPGIVTLVPVTGALFILLAGPSPSARLMLMNPVMSWLGKTSYSLYLVHWPIIVFYRYHFGSSLSALEQIALVSAILASGELMSRYVERRFRLVPGGSATAAGVSSRAVLLWILTTVLALVLAATLLIANGGWPSRIPDSARDLMKINVRQDWKRRKAIFEQQCTPKGEVFCGERAPNKTNILLIGDSRVPDMYIALRTAYPQAAVQASYALGCAPVFSPKFSDSPFFPQCPQFNEARMQAALEAPREDIVFLAQDINTWYSSAVLDTVKRLRAVGKTVYVLGQFKMLENKSPIEIAVDMLRFPAGSVKVENYLVDEPFILDREFADQVNAMGAVYISNKNLFFDGQYHLDDRESGKLLTYDGTHLNEFGAQQFGLYLGEKYPLR